MFVQEALSTNFLSRTQSYLFSKGQALYSELDGKYCSKKALLSEEELVFFKEVMLYRLSRCQWMTSQSGTSGYTHMTPVTLTYKTEFMTSCGHRWGGV